MKIQRDFLLINLSKVNIYIYIYIRNIVFKELYIDYRSKSID